MFIFGIYVTDPVTGVKTRQEINQSFGLPVTQAFNEPKDHSANPIAASGTLLATVLRNTDRNLITVQNPGAQALTLVRDDGVTGPSGPTGTAGTTTLFLLAGTTGGIAPSTYESAHFKGRLRVYGATGSAVSIAED